MRPLPVLDLLVKVALVVLLVSALEFPDLSGVEKAGHGVGRPGRGVPASPGPPTCSSALP